MCANLLEKQSQTSTVLNEHTHDNTVSDFQIDINKCIVLIKAIFIKRK